MKNSIENLYKKSNTETTSNTLDNLILAQAKQSCKPEKQSKSRRWMYPLATAAVFVMGFTVIFNLQNINQEMQVQPSVIEADKGIEIQYIPEFAKEKNKRAARNRKLPTKPPKLNTSKNELEKPSVHEIVGEMKDDTFSYLSTESVQDEINQTTPPAPKLELRLKQQLQEGESQLDAIIGSDEEKPATITNSSSPNKTKPLVSDGDLSLARRENNNNESDRQELDKVTVTGSRIRADKIAIPKDIQRLEDMIIRKRYTQAKRLLKKLKNKYPNYDFSELEKLLKK